MQVSQHRRQRGDDDRHAHDIDELDQTQAPPPRRSRTSSPLPRFTERKPSVTLNTVAVEQWSWLGDHLALDFANTVRRRGMRYVELITSAAELEVWLDHESGRVPVEAEVDDDLVTEFVGARDHALELLRAAATHRSLPATDVTAVNHLVLAAPAIRLLGTRPDQTYGRPSQSTRPPAWRRPRCRSHRAPQWARARDARAVRRPRMRAAVSARPSQPAMVQPALRHSRPLSAPRRAKRRPPTPAEPVTGQGRSELIDLASPPPHTGQQATRTKPATSTPKVPQLLASGEGGTGLNLSRRYRWRLPLGLVSAAWVRWWLSWCGVRRD